MDVTLGDANQTTGLILFINSVIILVLLVLVVVNSYNLRKFKKKYKKFMQAGFNEKNLEQLIDACIFKSQDAIDRSIQTQRLVNTLEANMLKTVQKVGVKRYSAFDDVGGDQSFSVALLDSLDNGIVLTGLFNRESSTVYIKSIELGYSKHTLTSEEIQAIDSAKRKFGDFPKGK